MLISNHAIVNPNKFQTIVITKRNLQNNPSINNMIIKPKDSVELLEVAIDETLNFEKHMKNFVDLPICQ